MISVPNHQRRLSGNNLILILILGIIFLNACSVQKKSTTQDNVQIIKADTKPKVVTNQEQKTNPSKPDTKTPSSTTIPTPTSTPKSVPVESKVVVVKVDTVKWKNDQKTPPITIIDKPKVVRKDGLELKDEYNVKILIPLNSDGYSTSALAESKYVHYYAGMLRALERLDDEGIKLNIDVFDTEEGGPIKDKLGEILNDKTDLVIGPFEKEDVKLFVENCKYKSIPIVSPWQTSTKITTENPYYIQMKPNLKEHYLKLVKSTVQEYSPEEVVIVGENNKETNSWINYFQDNAAQIRGSKKKDFYSTYFVSSDSLTNGPTAFFRMLKNPKLKAVILPNYSFTDENFIYSCLRRLMAEKGSRHISVFGMPILYDSEKIDFDFYHGLDMKIVMSDFVDENMAEIREFRRDYLDMYGEIPTADAIKGYDLMLYIGRNLWKYGRNFQNYLSNEATSYLQSTYDVQKARSEDATDIVDPSKFDYYENKHLDIIEFKGNRFQRK